MKDRKQQMLVGSILVGLILIFAIYKIVTRPPDSVGPADYGLLGKGGPCPGAVKHVTMTDGAMNGLINAGDKIRITLNYFACNNLKRGDFALYRYSNLAEPVVRRVVAIPGDKFKVVRDKNRPSWNLEVNGDLVKAGSEPYFFGPPSPPTLSIYEKPRNNILGHDEVIVFANVPPGNNDSGLFGVGSVVDLIGKVELEDGAPKEPEAVPSASPETTVTEDSPAGVQAPTAPLVEKSVPSTPAPVKKTKPAAVKKPGKTSATPKK